MSLTKQLRTRFQRFPLVGHRKSAPVDYIASRYKEDWIKVTKIWPDGTWTMPWGGGGTAVMDDVTRGTLIDLWAYEDLKSTGKLFGLRLDPAKFHANPIPDDWQPSEKLYRKQALSGRYAPQVVTHVVTQLGARGLLRP
jgi:hypothetical protein